mmetsp:Transcript_33441/g.85443  ORF Transcript_33441/g.85443 Transcript_33441/m.85443 type:complete len:219 (-) Transcript_33441:65-721(-)
MVATLSPACSASRSQAVQGPAGRRWSSSRPPAAARRRSGPRWRCSSPSSSLAPSATRRLCCEAGSAVRHCSRKLGARSGRNQPSAESASPRAARSCRASESRRIVGSSAEAVAAQAQRGDSPPCSPMASPGTLSCALLRAAPTPVAVGLGSRSPARLTAALPAVLWPCCRRATVRSGAVEYSGPPIRRLFAANPRANAVLAATQRCQPVPMKGGWGLG